MQTQGGFWMHAFLVEVPDKPGSLAGLSAALADRGINIAGIAAATCGGTGTIGLITNDEETTRSVLSGRGDTFRETDLVSATLENKPGTLANATRRLADAGINIDFVTPSGMEGNKLTLALGVDNAESARQALGELAAVGM
jgi:hypothetical protein